MILATLHAWIGFGAYFFVALLFFGLFWKGLDRIFGSIEEKNRRHFEEKVDRYRRGHRS